MARRAQITCGLALCALLTCAASPAVAQDTEKTGENSLSQAQQGASTEPAQTDSKEAEQPRDTDEATEAPDSATPPGTTDPNRQLSARDRKDLESMGFVFSDSATLASTSSATLMALTLGTLVHGIGHIHAGDVRTGRALLVAEAISVTAMIGSGLFMIADGGASTLTGLAAPVFQFGLGLFVASWILDVVGSVQGATLQLPTSTSNRDRLEAEVGYGFISSTSSPTRHALRAALVADLGLVHFEAETVQDVLLGASVYRVEAGTRLFRVRPQTFVSISGVGELFQVSDSGEFNRYGAEVRLGGSFDLGALYSQFSDVAIGAWVGYGNHWFAFENTLDPGDFDTRLDFLAHKVFFAFNVSERLNLGYGYGSHPGDLLTPSGRLLGISEIRLDYQTDFGAFRLHTQIGDGVALWIGGGIEF